MDLGFDSEPGYEKVESLEGGKVDVGGDYQPDLSLLGPFPTLLPLYSPTDGLNLALEQTALGSPVSQLDAAGVPPLPCPTTLAKESMQAIEKKKLKRAKNKIAVRKYKTKQKEELVKLKADHAAEKAAKEQVLVAQEALLKFNAVLEEQNKALKEEIKVLKARITQLEGKRTRGNSTQEASGVWRTPVVSKLVKLAQQTLPSQGDMGLHAGLSDDSSVTLYCDAPAELCLDLDPGDCVDVMAVSLTASGKVGPPGVSQMRLVGPDSLGARWSFLDDYDDPVELLPPMKFHCDKPPGFAVMFVFFAVDEDGKRDKVVGGFKLDIQSN